MNHRYIVGGILGGLVAGVVFGVVSQVTGMMPMIAMLVQSKSTTIGWIVHLAISVVGGVVFAAVFGRLARTYSGASAWGLLYGIIWWLFGMLIAMPAILGMPVELGSAFDQMNTVSLYGHLLWGVVLAIVFVFYRREETAVEPKEIWRTVWPFAVIMILLARGALAVPAGPAQMESGSMMENGSGAPHMESNPAPMGAAADSGSMKTNAEMPMR